MEPWSDEELRIKVGQLFIVGFHGHVPGEDVKDLISTYKVGSIILFQRNVASVQQLLDLTAALQKIAKDGGSQATDLFIGIDQENGLVTRIKPPVAAQLPGSMALGATGDPLNAFNIAEATAEMLKSFGINMNYAPIADINSEPKNPVIGVRSPSDDPETVGRFVSAQVKGLMKSGIVPCVKHFPGHGDTAVDSHYGLPVISKSRQELDECELVPFRRAIAEGVEAVMTAHIAMPGLGDDPESAGLPASLNPSVISIMREEMKFEGLIVSDCLEMDGVRASFGTEKGAVMALKAGTDCVMICHTMSAQVGAIERVVLAVKSGEISQEAIEASYQRVMKTKALRLNHSSILQTSTVEALEAIKLKQTTLAAKIYAESTTVVRSESGSIPISLGDKMKIVFVSPGKSHTGGGAVESGEEKTRESYTPTSYIDILRAHKSNITDVRYQDGTSLSSAGEQDLAEADIILFATRNASLRSYQKNLGLSLGKKYGKKLVVIATCDPYDFLEEKEEIKNYIVTYEPTIPAFKSAVDIIFGFSQPLGKLPVGILAAQHELQLLGTSDEEIARLSFLWENIFPNWPIESQRLAKIIRQGHGKHVIHKMGFCLSFLMPGGNGEIAAVGVLPEYRGKGLGTVLLRRAQKELRIGLSLMGMKRFKSLNIGSVFPRLWPEIPNSFSDEQKKFFLHRGFRKSGTPTARDLYRDIAGGVAPQEILDRVSKSPFKFSPWSADLYEECMAKQRANFSQIGWVEAYERLAAANQFHEVMVAFDPQTNAQVGWSLMCSPTAVISEDFAFLPLMPSKGKTGLVACVGVDKSARGKGIGLSLLVKAMENMRERGVKGVCIDWVVIRGFYEKLGFEVCWEYEGYYL